jgi:NitT/TauT family transport system ATP-binding protein
MLELSHAAWGIDGTTIVAAIDLTVAKGELTVVIGPSGTGKSTLLRLAAGLIGPTKGICRNTFCRTAMVFQEPRLLPWASAADNIALVLETDGLDRKTRMEKAAEWLMRLGFSPEDILKRPSALSGGMRARVAIARAFVTNPDLVLLDEPFAALDLGLRRDLQGLTRKLADETGAAVLFVTHDLPEAVRLADRIVVMAGKPGTVTASLPNTPVDHLTDVWLAAATLSRAHAIAPIIEGLAG